MIGFGTLAAAALVLGVCLDGMVQPEHRAGHPGLRMGLLCVVFAVPVVCWYYLALNPDRYLTIGGLMVVVVVAAVFLKAQRLDPVNTVLALGATLAALLIWRPFGQRRSGKLPTPARWGVFPLPRTIGVAILFGIGSGSAYLIVQHVVDRMMSAPGSPADGKGGGLFGAWIILTLTVYEWSRRAPRPEADTARSREPTELDPPSWPGDA